MRIIDLTVPISGTTYSPPSVNKPIGVEVRTRESEYGGETHYWQLTKVDMALHSGPHVDFSRHHAPDGETVDDVELDRVCGRAVLFDLGQVDPRHRIGVDDLERVDPGLERGQIALVRTHWTDRAWGEFPRYYVDSPECSPEAAEWLVERGAKAVGFDCFPEGSAKKTDYEPHEFVIHRTFGEAGVVLMQQLCHLDLLPRSAPVDFFGPFMKFAGAEGAPARFFAVT
ncbi:MAG: cyclase family protein [Acidimicrobiia bacterium]|nr:cyclase family protein [Acidimicrobiia bacterium]MDH4305977.1 cyclase family protein [Acidimicrobiia bacterium]MDH5293688.1 cyclase family protein [Acidimicrobiia bacterium]